MPGCASHPRCRRASVISRFPLSLAIGFQRLAPQRDERRINRALADEVASDVSRRLSRDYRVTDHRATRTGTLLVRLHAQESLIAKLSLRPTNEPRLRHSADALKTLHTGAWVTPFLADRCPRVVSVGTASGHYFSVETTVPGHDGLHLLKTKVNALELVLSAERFILKLQKASLNANQAWEADFEAAAERVARLADLVDRRARYTELVTEIRSRLDGRAVPSAYSHGNFWPGNVLYDTDNTLTGVIDWDGAAAASLPVVDLIYFLVRTHSLVRGGSFGEGFADWMDAPSLPLLDGCLTRHCQDLAIPLDLIVPLSYCSWIQHLDAHCRFGTATSLQPRWLRRNVRVVLDRWRPRTDQGPFGTRRWSERAWR